MPTRERTEKSKAKAAGAATKPRGKAPAGYPNWSEALADWTNDDGEVRPAKKRKQPQPQPSAAAASSSAQPTQQPSDPIVPAAVCSEHNTNQSDLYTFHFMRVSSAWPELGAAYARLRGLRLSRGLCAGASLITEKEREIEDATGRLRRI